VLLSWKISWFQSLSVKPNVLIFNVAKHDLGKVRLEPMQSAVPPLTVRDLTCWRPLRDLQGCCVILHCTCFSTSWSLRIIWSVFLRIFAGSHPFPSLPHGCRFVGKYGSGKSFPLIYSVWRCRLAAASRGWFPLPGLPWIPPFLLTTSAPR